MTAATGAARPLTGALNTVASQPHRRSSSPPRYRFAGLDALPAVAAGLALAYALAGTAARLHPPGPLGRLLAGGFVSVDLLLVLTGFLIGRYLLEPGLRTGRLIGRLLRRLVPLHLLAWVIAFAWLGSQLAGAPIGTARGWVAGALLLSGFTRPDPAGYPLAGALSAGFWTAVAAVVLVAIMTRVIELAARVGPIGASARFGRANRISRVDPAAPVLLVALIALAAGGRLIATDTLLGLDSPSTALIRRALLGIGTGMLTVLWLRARTGPVAPPTPKTVARRHFPADVGAGLALAAVLFCVYRTDLMGQSHLLPLYPVAGVLIFFLTQTRPNSPSSAGHPSRLQLALSSTAGRWLGSRAWAIFVLHGAVLITVERISVNLGRPPASAGTNWSILLETLLGTLVLADVSTRLLTALPEPRPISVPPPVTRLLNAQWTPELTTVPAGPVPTAIPEVDAAPNSPELTTSSISRSTTPPRSAAASPAKTTARDDIPPELRLRPRIRKDVVNPRSSDPQESASSLKKEELARKAAARQADAAKAALEKAAAKKEAAKKEVAAKKTAATKKATEKTEKVDLTGTTLDLTSTDLTTAESTAADLTTADDPAVSPRPASAPESTETDA
jgi:hypothetical protein